MCSYKPELSRLVAAGIAKGPEGCVNINDLCFAGHGLSILLTGTTYPPAATDVKGCFMCGSMQCRLNDVKECTYVASTGEAAGKLHTVVFDGGPSRQLWRHNAEKLRLPLCDIEAVVLSHWYGIWHLAHLHLRNCLIMPIELLCSLLVLDVTNR